MIAGTVLVQHGGWGAEALLPSCRRDCDSQHGDHSYWSSVLKLKARRPSQLMHLSEFLLVGLCLSLIHVFEDWRCDGLNRCLRRLDAHAT